MSPLDLGVGGPSHQRCSRTETIPKVEGLVAHCLLECIMLWCFIHPKRNPSFFYFHLFLAQKSSFLLASPFCQRLYKMRGQFKGHFQKATYHWGETLEGVHGRLSLGVEVGGLAGASDDDNTLEVSVSSTQASQAAGIIIATAFEMSAANLVGGLEVFQCAGDGCHRRTNFKKNRGKHPN